MRGAVLAKPSRPMIALRFPTRSDSLPELFVHAVGNQKFRVLGPAVEALGQLYFLFTERFTVRFLGVLFVRRAPADVAVHNDQCRTIARAEKRSEGGANHVQ